jgi:hypothetical protein
MLLNLDNKSTGSIVPIIIMIPPIVGVPFFLLSPFKPSDLTFSPILFIVKILMIFLPKKIEVVNEKISANEALNEIY